MTEFRKRESASEIGEVASQMLRREISFLEGIRKIVALRLEAGLLEDPDVMVLVAIDSETDALPLGPQITEHWQPQALAALRPQIDDAENWARAVGITACRSLVERFGSGSSAF